MSLLCQITQFFRFSQFIGAIPYSMDIIDDKVKSKRVVFSFSWRKVMSWWFVIMVSFSLSTPVFSAFGTMEVVNSWDIPKITYVVALLIGITFYIIFIVSRWIALRSKKWKRILRSIDKIETFLSLEGLLGEVKSIRNVLLISVSLATGLVGSEFRRQA